MAERTDSLVRNPQSAIRILVTAGPTREFFDTVRFISNPSTGKQGYAIAAVAAGRGHQVVLVSGPVDLPAPTGVKLIRVTTAGEMAEACKVEFDDCAAAILTAAVCDYRPPHRLSHKLKKKAEPISITLEPTEDICSTLGKIKGKRIVVGFSMDDHDARASAEAKLARKNCDLIVLNGPENIGADRAEVHIFSPQKGWGKPIAGTKTHIAEHVISLIERQVERPS